jgi:hypothetical protein
MTPKSVRLVERGDGVTMPGHRAEGLANAKAVADATDPERHLSPTPPNPLGDVDGVADRPGNLSPA